MYEGLMDKLDFLSPPESHKLTSGGEKESSRTTWVLGVELTSFSQVFGLYRMRSVQDHYCF